MRILVVNAGSQSVKLTVLDEADHVFAAKDLGPPGDGLAPGLAAFLEEAGPVEVAGHRVVHGGRLFTQPVVIDAEVRRQLETLNALAPLHNLPALVAIDTVTRLLQGTPSIACFDTAFHAHLPPAVSAYAVPAEWASQWGIRRFGFHGLSCAWATRRAAEMLDRPVETFRLIVCHLGGGASATAIAGGHSVDTTMGFTPLEGLVMATRSGDLDPGAILWVLQQHGLSAGDVESALNHRSGLFGLSAGRSSDMRLLVTAANEEHDAPSRLAVEVYVHRLRAKIAAMMASTAGTDVLVFTGGVGEHSSFIRSAVCDDLEWLGIDIDSALNAAAADLDVDISTPDAQVRTLVIHAREDLEIADQCRRVTASTRDVRSIDSPLS